MYTEDSPLIAPPVASSEHALAYILAHPHDNYSDDDIRTAIVPTYFALCTDVGIDPILAVAQMIHETGNLTSFWSARPQRNPAGIGVNSRKQAERPPDITGWAFNTQRQIWEMGLSFMTWKDDAIPAHVGRLLAYVLPKGTENAAQRELIERAMAYRSLPDTLRGTAPTLKPLGKAHNPAGDGWASPGIDYGAKIAVVARQIVAGNL
jgi:Mannosyl-glycoprotein endo-beta-N-acetylglucosaminidase